MLAMANCNTQKLFNWYKERDLLVDFKWWEIISDNGLLSLMTGRWNTRACP